MQTRLSALLGPIFAKEMLEMSRRWRYYASRVLFGLAILYAVYVVLSQDRQPLGTRAMSIVAPRFVAEVGWIQIVAVYVLVPFFLCGVITSERDARTLEQLFCTHLTNREIVLGKLVSRLVVMAMLVLSGIPVLNMFMLFGGISFMQVWVMEAATLLAIVHVGAFGIYWATISRTAFQALWRTYACTLAMLFLPFASPAFSFSFSISNRAATSVDATLLVINCILILLLALTLTFKATSRVRDDLPAKKLWRSKILKRRTAEDASSGVLQERAGAVAEKMRAVWGPLQIAVVDQEPSLRKNLWVLFPLLFSFVFNYILAIRFETEAMSHILLVIWSGSFVLTVIVAITNPLFSRRPGFFDLLLGTLLNPNEILKGAVTVSGPWLLRIFLVPWVFGILWSSWNPGGIVLVLITGSLFVCYILMLGNLCSLADHRATTRLTSTFVFPLLLAAAPWMLPYSFRQVDPAVLWMLSAGFLFVAWLWTRASLSAPSVASLITAVYLFLLSSLLVVPGALLGAWNADTEITLFVSPWHWMSKALTSHGKIDVALLAQFFAQWAAGALTMAWSWIWTLRNFDRLVGRTLQDQSTPVPRVAKLEYAEAI